MDNNSSFLEKASLTSREAVVKAWRNIVFALANVFFFSIVFVITKHFEHTNSVSALLTNATLLVGCSVFGTVRVLTAKPIKLPPFKWHLYNFSVYRAFTNVTYLIFSVLAYRNMNQDTASAIMYLFPVTSSLFGVVFLGEKLHNSTKVKFSVCLVGTVMMCQPFANNSANTAFGYFMAFLSLIVSTITPLFSKLKNKAVDPDFFMVISIVFYVPTLALWYWIEGDNSYLTVSSAFLLALTGVFYSIGLFFYEKSLKGCDISIVTQFDFVMLALAFLYNIFIFGNEFSVIKFLGCLLMLLANMQNAFRAIFNV